MKDDNLPPDNETVEDGGGCYVAGSREQDAAHSFTENDSLELIISKTIGIKVGAKPLTPMDYSECKMCMQAYAKEELTRLRSELQQKESEWKDGLNQLGFHIEHDEESQSWFAQRDHEKAKIIVASDKKETLANEIILSYQALLMHAYSELQYTKSYYEDKLDARQRTIDRQFSELQQKDELIKKLIEAQKLQS